MKHLTTIAAFLLGLIFIVFGLNFFLHFIAIPMPPEGSAAAAFMGALFSTGYLKFVKILEIVGGILLVLPKTRTLGLVILTPIVVNILCFHTFLTGGVGIETGVVMAVLNAYLVFSNKPLINAVFGKA